jgi:perosamine synthetase
MSAVLDNKLSILDFIRSLYGSGPVPLHRPVFSGNERKYLVDCVDSNFVSSVGERVTEFEQQVARFTGARFAVATVNGTAALHAALQLVGVQRGDEVLSQALTFVATCNALSYLGAHPVFVDVDQDTMGLSPGALSRFLKRHAVRRDGQVWNKATGRRIAACVPMHTFGLPCRIFEIASICEDWRIPLVEDAAESLGSYARNRHTGTFGRIGTLSFNGNKIITTGGGGMLVTDDEQLAVRAKHLTTTAKIPHAYEFEHDDVGYNYRLPNLNAALGCAQMEQLPGFLRIKSEVAARYADFFERLGIEFARALEGDVSNCWLNAIVLDSLVERDEFLRWTNSNGVMTRPVWRLMTRLRMFDQCQHDGLENSVWLESRVVNLPSSIPASMVTTI